MSNAFVMPLSPVDGKPLYNASGSVADVFLACAKPNGATIAEIKKLLNTDVALYPLTRHADTRGRRGLRWNLMLDGKPLDRFTVDLPNTSRVAIVNIRKSDSFVNSRHPRSTPGNTAALVSARSAASTDVPTTKPPATPTVVPPAVKTPNTRRSEPIIGTPAAKGTVKK